MLGLFLNQGQCCCAGSRLFVQDKVYDEFVERLAAQGRSRASSATRSTTRPSRARRSTRRSSTRSWATSRRQAARGAGASPAANGTATKGYFIKPTIFADVKDDMKIASEEIFGPVLSVIKFKDVDEVVQRANTTDYGLAAAVWTRDIGKAHSIADRIRPGPSGSTATTSSTPPPPSAASRRSGIGRELGEKSLDNYTELKTVTVALCLIP